MAENTNQLHARHNAGSNVSPKSLTKSTYISTWNKQSKRPTSSACRHHSITIHVSLTDDNVNHGQADTTIQILSVVLIKPLR